jgi:hypothetical protein
MDDAQSFTSQILNTYNPNSVIPFTDTDGFYHFTYLTINTVNNKFYLGKHTTKDLNDGYIGSGIAFLNAVKKHGYLNFQHYRLQFFNTAQDAYVAEALLITEDVIKKYKDELKVCYNLKTGGGSGGILSEESKAKISKAIKETWSRPEVKEKQSKAQKELHARPEYKEKISKVRKDAFAKPEYKAKMSKALKEAMNRPEIKEKISKVRKESKAKKEMIYQSTGEKKTIHINDMLSHLKASWTFTQGYIIIYNKKLNLQKTIMFKNNKDKGALYKKLIGYLENGYEIGHRPRGIKSEVFVVVAGSEYCSKRKMVSLF